MVGLTASWKDLKQKILPRTLYARSLMIIVLPILVMQTIVAYIFINRDWETMSDKLVYALTGEIYIISDQVRQAATPEDVNAIVNDAAAHLGLEISIEVPKIAETRISTPVNLFWHGTTNKLQKSLTEKIGGDIRVQPSPLVKRFEVVIQLDDDRVLRFIAPNNRLISPTTYVFILWLIGSSVILMATAVIFMRNQIRPIQRLVIAAEKLGKGQDVADLKLEGAREVRQAARAFLEMRDRIRRQIAQRTAMLAGVSHDLRTPLTRMRLQLAMLKDSSATDNLRLDLDEMEKMLEGYLTFARGEGSEYTVAVDLKTVVDRIVNNSRRQNGDVEACYEGEFMVRVRPMAIERALSNIINNACKYAQHVWVDMQSDAEAVEIFVDDDGPGIPEAQREEVFKPFFRLEQSRNQKTGGVGLGLSIAQDIVHSHGGDIMLEQSRKGGLRVVVRLPL